MAGWGSGLVGTSACLAGARLWDLENKQQKTSNKTR
jgi:hypothetical protein